jgi:Ca2+-transporting ATPase
VIAAKGAPEAIADLSHLDAAATETMIADVSRMADQGLRVLGVARAAFKVSAGLPEIQHGFDFEFIGLVGLQDPIRPDVAAAVAEARAAGMRVVMITGDYPGTALAISRAAGLDAEGQVLTGAELEALSDEELAACVGGITVFARVVPEQKLRIVRALKRGGEVVAMTGDGVNDAPALKAADIGIAMGQRGTDVAREAAALVLTDDDFGSIVRAVRMGRRIFDNLKKAMAYILAVHVPIAGMSPLPVLLPKIAGHPAPLVLMPVHIAFLELIIDPACSVVFEAEGEERDIMQRPPRRVSEALFSGRMITTSVLQGTGVLAAVLGVYLWAVFGHLSADLVRSLTFTTLVTGNLALIFVNRSWTHTMVGGLRRPNRALWWIAGGAVATLTFVLLAPFTQDLFGFGAPDVCRAMAAAFAGVMSVLWFEVYKLVRHRGHERVA